MDIADIIIFILFIAGGAVVQWWKSRQENNSEKKTPPYLEEPFPKQPAPRRNPDLDDLMEALGQAPKKKEASSENRIPPVLPPPMSARAPVIVPRQAKPIPEPPVYVPRAEPESVSYESITSHDEDLNKRFAQFSSFDIEDAAAARKLPPAVVLAPTKASQQNPWRQDLRSGRTLRKAVVLNEILQPPLALR
jgi:hypothetical protein